MSVFSRSSQRVCGSIVAALMLFGWASSAVAEEGSTPGEWDKYFEVYGWLPNIYITSGSGSHTTLTLKDLLNNLDMIAFVDFGTKNGDWSFGNDTVYMNLGKKITREGEVLPTEVDVKLDMRSLINTTKIGYQIGGDDSNPFSLIGGVRYLYLKTSAEFDTDNIGEREILRSGSNWSGIVGFEGKKTLNDKWYMIYYADMGAGGKTELTWQAKIGGGYHFNSFTGTFGLRYLRYNFDRNSALENMRVIGPYIGARWNF